MATGGTNENNRAYLFRLQMLLIDGGLLVLKTILDQKLLVQGITFDECLNIERETIKQLKRRRQITQEQYDMLFPLEGVLPTTSDLDITLAICLLRNLKCFGLNKKFNWIATPVSTDVSLEADIWRLRDHRNNICHISTTNVISSNELTLRWTDIEQILVRQSPSVWNIHQIITDFKTCPLDVQEEKKIQAQINKWEEFEAKVDRLEKRVTVLEGEVDSIKISQDNADRNSGNGKISYVSKTTNITIGENAQTINFIDSKHMNVYEVIKSRPEVQEKSKPFQSFYSESKAQEEERNQFTSPWRQNATPPGGNFIDTREVRVNEFVFDASVRVDASRWVCMICFPGRNGIGDGSGTGFRVGPRYIMTANHVVKEILDSGYQQVGQTQDPLSSLQGPDVYAVFNFTTDNPVTDRQKFRFKACVPFCDEATDIAILELEDNSVGTAMPLPFTYFSLPRLNNSFTFIGHSMGRPLEFNRVERIIDTNSAETQQNIRQVKQWSLQHTGKDYEFPPHDTLTNRNRFLFHCKFTKGGSGSPGVVILPDGRVVVVTMLLCGFPNWYYGSDVHENVKAAWNKEYCVEQGVNLKSVFEKISLDKPTLCREIFYDPDDICDLK